jgi:hypothetical protein
MHHVGALGAAAHWCGGMTRTRARRPRWAAISEHNEGHALPQLPTIFHNVQFNSKAVFRPLEEFSLFPCP